MGLFDALLLAAVVGSLDVFVLAMPQALPHDPASTSGAPQPPPSPAVPSNLTFTNNMTAGFPHPDDPGQALNPTSSTIISSSTVLIVAAHTEITAGGLDTPTSTTTTSSNKPAITFLIPHGEITGTALNTPSKAPKARVESTASSFDVPIQITSLPDAGGTAAVVPVTETARVEVTAGALDGAGPQSLVTSVAGGSAIPAVSDVPGHALSDGPNVPAVTSAPGSPGQPIYVGSVPVTSGTLILEGTTYSLESSSGSLYVNGVLTPMTAVSPAYESAVYVASTAVLPGSSAQVIGGTTYSLADSGSTLFVDGSPTPVSALQQQQTSPTAVFVEGHTILPGSSAQVITSKTYSLATDGSVLYVNGVASTVSTTASASAAAESSGSDRDAAPTSQGSGTGGGDGSSTGHSTPSQTSPPQVQTKEGVAGMLVPRIAGAGIGLLAVMLL